MQIKTLMAASAAIAIAATFIDVPIAEARGNGGRFTVQKMQRARVVQPRVTVKKVVKFEKKTVVRTAPRVALVKKNTGLKLGKVKLANLPVRNAAAGTTFFKGRLGVPQNVKPKFTLTKAPTVLFQKKMGPFVQKNWKKAFFWVAIAGIGYVTVPELYYDRFLGYIEDDDYDAGVRLLSTAAFEEEEQTTRVRYPMPPTATYRYQAQVAPQPSGSAVQQEGSDQQTASTSCALEPFVERKWNTAFVWVQVPQTGNVTVPEDYYDRVHELISADRPNYPAACAVLVEAAAADMMTTTTSSLDNTTPRSEIR